MRIVVIGTHQQTAPVALRECLAFEASGIAKALTALRAYVDEGLILSTCNRVEVFGVVARDESDRALRHFLADSHGIAPEQLDAHLYTHTGIDAVRHVFRLASGLDSMVLGEDQIMGQLKAALAEAHAVGAAGRFMYRLLHNALETGKLVRTRTGIARNHLSVVSVALDIAREHLGGLAGRRVLIVGAGRMAELSLKHLRSAAPQSVVILGRSLDRASALADAYGAQAHPLTALEEQLRAADVVISCTSSPDMIIGAEAVAQAMVGRQDSLQLLDLAVPRDIDPLAAHIPGVYLCDIDGMQVICAANRAARAAEITAAEAIIEGAVEKFMAWWAAREVVPTIKALREHAEAIRQAELERTLARLPDLSPGEQQTIQAMSAAIVNKLLHQPIAALKETHNDSQLAQAVQELFHLDKPSL